MARPFSWTPRKWRVAALAAEGRLTPREIARETELALATVERWLADPVCRVEVQRLRDEAAQRAFQEGIALKEERLRLLNERHLALQRVARERGIELGESTDPEVSGAAGAGTGLVTTQLRAVGSGESQQIVREFKLDTALLNEFRALEQQAAQELGEWVTKTDTKLSGGVTVGTMTLDNCDGDELRRRLADAAEALLPDRPGAVREA